MKNLAMTIVASAMLSGAANMASAEQFIVELEKPITGDDAALRASLLLVEIDSFQHNQNSVVVFEAKDIAVLEAYFYAMQLKPLSVLSFPTAWSDTGVEAMAIEARMSFLNNVECEFCAN